MRSSGLEKNQTPATYFGGKVETGAWRSALSGSIFKTHDLPAERIFTVH
jgi:hypothetical protein